MTFRERRPENATKNSRRDWVPAIGAVLLFACASNEPVAAKGPASSASPTPLEATVEVEGAQASIVARGQGSTPAAAWSSAEARVRAAVDALIRSWGHPNKPSPFAAPDRQQAWLRNLQHLLTEKVVVRDAGPTETGYSATAQLRWTHEDLGAWLQDLTGPERAFLLREHQRAIGSLKVQGPQP